MALGDSGSGGYGHEGSGQGAYGQMWLCMGHVFNGVGRGCVCDVVLAGAVVVLSRCAVVGMEVVWLPRMLCSVAPSSRCVVW